MFYSSFSHLCRHIAVFVGALPPTVDQRNRVTRMYVHAHVCLCAQDKQNEDPFTEKTAL